MLIAVSGVIVFCCCNLCEIIILSQFQVEEMEWDVKSELLWKMTPSASVTSSAFFSALLILITPIILFYFAPLNCEL